MEVSPILPATLSDDCIMRRFMFHLSLLVGFAFQALEGAAQSNEPPTETPRPSEITPPTDTKTPSAPDAPDATVPASDPEPTTESTPPVSTSEALADSAAATSTPDPIPQATASTPQDPIPDPIVRRELPNIGSLMNERIPGQPWRIHDATRPRPRKVTPPSENNAPPSDAMILFDGTDLSQWCHRSQDESYEPNWRIIDGVLEVRPGAGNLYSIDGFGSSHLHIEFRIPAEVHGVSQNRGNSGIKLMERFEVQVLDSFANRTYADGQAGAIYGQYPPLANACKPAGEWQTFEIFFTAPQFEEDSLVSPAYLTVIHNEVLVHYHRELPGPTGARLPHYTPLTPAAPIMLQDHGSPVQFRNIWIRELPL